MLSVPALNACRTKVQRQWVLGSGTKGEGDELVWAIPTTTITKRCGFCQAFFYLPISGDYKPEFTPLVDTELLHVLQLHLTRAGPVTRLGRWGQVQGIVRDACAPLVSVANIVLGDTTKGSQRVAQLISHEVSVLGWAELLSRLPWPYCLGVQSSFSIPGTQGHLRCHAISASFPANATEGHWASHRPCAISTSPGQMSSVSIHTYSHTYRLTDTQKWVFFSGGKFPPSSMFMLRPTTSWKSNLCV